MLQGCFRLRDWLSLCFLRPWINWSKFWQFYSKWIAVSLIERRIDFLYFEFMLIMFIDIHALNREYRVVGNRYSRLLFTTEDQHCANLRVQDNRQIWRQNGTTSRSCDVTDHLWWRHNAKSDNTVLGDNGEISDRWLFLVDLYVRGIEYSVKNTIIYGLPWIPILSHVTRFGNDKKSVFTVTHTLLFIYTYIKTRCKSHKTAYHGAENETPRECVENRSCDSSDLPEQFRSSLIPAQGSCCRWSQRGTPAESQIPH